MWVQPQRLVCCCGCCVQLRTVLMSFASFSSRSLLLNSLSFSAFRIRIASLSVWISPFAASLSLSRSSSPGRLMGRGTSPLYECGEPEPRLPPEWRGALPWWAFLWPGGYGLASHVQDNPAAVRGRRVVDFGCGCGVAGIAALRAGAAACVFNDLDPVAVEASLLNAGRSNDDVISPW